MRESKIEAELRKSCLKNGYKTYKLQGVGVKNAPDRIILQPHGRAFFVECKAPGEVPNAAQLREHTRLKRLGFDVYILDTMEDIPLMMEAQKLRKL